MSGLKKNARSAPGPMLGYLFQIERALLWLSLTSVAGTVSIETDDDIVIDLQNGKELGVIYEQDKSAALSSRNPFSNASKDLWKSLKIWAVSIMHGEVDLDVSFFLLVTNKKINGGLFKKLVSKKSNPVEFDSILTQLMNAGLKSSSDEVLEYAQIVDALRQVDSGLFKEFFKKIDLLDVTYSHDRADIKNKIRSNLHISEQLPLNLIYKDLLGWLTDLIIQKWLLNAFAVIEGRELNNYLTNLIGKYNEKPFLEKAKDVLPIEKLDRAAEKNENFVKQLSWIKLKEPYVLNAIDDFIRAKWERNKFALEGNIPSKKDFDKMDDDLFERWENMKAPLERKCTCDEDKLNHGHDLYWSVIDYKAKLANYDTEEYYTTKGAYHILANEFRLGWHFDWEKLKEGENEE